MNTESAAMRRTGVVLWLCYPRLREWVPVKKSLYHTNQETTP